MPFKWTVNSEQRELWRLHGDGSLELHSTNAKFGTRYWTEIKISIFQKLYLVGLSAIFALACADVSHILPIANSINGLAEDSRSYLPPVQPQKPTIFQVNSDTFFEWSQLSYRYWIVAASGARGSSCANCYRQQWIGNRVAYIYPFRIALSDSAQQRRRSASFCMSNRFKCCKSLFTLNDCITGTIRHWNIRISGGKSLCRRRRGYRTDDQIDWNRFTAIDRSTDQTRARYCGMFRRMVRFRFNEFIAKFVIGLATRNRVGTSQWISCCASQWVRRIS